MDKFYHSRHNESVTKGTIFEFFQTVAIALAFYTILHLFVVQPNKVEGGSMVPTFHTGDRIMTSKLTYRFGVPERQDVIVFAPPDSRKGDFIKRIVGMPGETIKIDQGQVSINGQLLPEPYLSANANTIERRFLRNGVPFLIPGGQYMVFGDNREFSSDSRELGPITRAEIIGKVWVQYWPVSNIHTIP